MSEPSAKALGECINVRADAFDRDDVIALLDFLQHNDGVTHPAGCVAVHHLDKDVIAWMVTEGCRHKHHTKLSSVRRQGAQLARYHSDE